MAGTNRDTDDEGDTTPRQKTRDELLKWAEEQLRQEKERQQQLLDRLGGTLDKVFSSDDDDDNATPAESVEEEKPE